jgi:hypothetical protein
MKERAQRRAEPGKSDIDASGWREPLMETTKKTGARPITKRAFKRGGKVNMKAEGPEGLKHAGKKPRGNHDDAAMDKKLIKSMVSQKALKKADGGQTVNRAGKGDYAGNYPADLSNADLAKILAAKAAADAKEKAFQANQPHKRGGKVAHDKDCACKACGGAAMGKADGGSTYGDSTPLRLVKTIKGSNPNKHAKVYKDKDWGEYRVKHYENGKHLEKADAHTDDKEDAMDTANYFVNKKRGGSVNHMGKASGGDVEDNSPPDAMAGLPRYNEDAVNKAIAASNRSGKKIGKKEAEMIHAVLKGRTGRNDGGKDNSNSDDQFKHPYFGDVRQYEGKKWDEEKEKWIDKKSRTGRKSGGRTGKAGGGKFGIDNPFEGEAGDALDMGASIMSPAYALARGKLPGLNGVMAGLMGGKGKKAGGAAKGNYEGGTRPTGGRIAKQGGGSLQGLNIGRGMGNSSMGGGQSGMMGRANGMGRGMGGMGRGMGGNPPIGTNPATGMPRPDAMLGVMPARPVLGRDGASYNSPPMSMPPGLGRGMPAPLSGAMPMGQQPYGNMSQMGAQQSAMGAPLNALSGQSAMGTPLGSLYGGAPIGLKTGGRAQRKSGGRIAKQGGGSLQGGQKEGAGDENLRSMLKQAMKTSGGHPMATMMQLMDDPSALFAAARNGRGKEVMPTGSGASSGEAMPTGSRVPYYETLGRKDGGRTKGKTSINININTAPKPQMPMPMPMPPLPPMGAGGPPMGMPPDAGGPPPGMPPMPPMGAGGPPPGMPPLPPPEMMAAMGRKAGGRVYRSAKDMDAGAGGGLGRLEKTEIQKRKR